MEPSECEAGQVAGVACSNNTFDDQNVHTFVLQAWSGNIQNTQSKEDLKLLIRNQWSMNAGERVSSQWGCTSSKVATCLTRYPGAAMAKLLKYFECMQSMFLRKSSLTGCPCCNHWYQESIPGTFVWQEEINSNVTSQNLCCKSMTGVEHSRLSCVQTSNGYCVSKNQCKGEDYVPPSNQKPRDKGSCIWSAHNTPISSLNCLWFHYDFNRFCS